MEPTPPPSKEESAKGRECCLEWQKGERRKARTEAREFQKEARDLQEEAHVKLEVALKEIKDYLPPRKIGNQESYYIGQMLLNTENLLLEAIKMLQYADQTLKNAEQMLENAESPTACPSCQRKHTDLRSKVHLRPQRAQRRS